MVAPSSGFVAHNVCQADCATATHKMTKRTNMERRRNNCRFYDINDYGDVNGAPWNDVEEELNKSYEGVKPRFQTPKLNLPTRIVEFKMKADSDNTLNMILDGGWEISFRIHNASTKVEQSLKFDVKLLGNPPVFFTQYLFQENEID